MIFGFSISFLEYTNNVILPVTLIGIGSAILSRVPALMIEALLYKNPHEEKI